MADQTKSNEIEYGIQDVEAKLKGLSGLFEYCNGPINKNHLMGLSIILGGFADELNGICNKFLDYSCELETSG